MIGVRSIFKNIKGYKIQTLNIDEGHRLFVLFLLGIVAGTMIINLFGVSYADKICIYGEYLTDSFERLSIIAMEKGKFFAFCMKKYFIQVVIIVLLNLTSKGRIFNCLICLYKGCIISTLICAATISYGSGGLLLFMASVFPHYLIYIPLYIYTFYFVINLKNNVSTSKHILSLLKGAGVEGGLIVSTAFLEAYVNLPMIVNLLK